MKTKTLSFSMMAALTHMFDNEVRATKHSPDACRNVEIGFFIKSNTATALEKRGLALRVCCPFDCEEIELQLTESGRHWVKQNTRTTANGCSCVTCAPGGELDPLKVAGRCDRLLPKAPSPAPKAPQETAAAPAPKAPLLTRTMRSALVDMVQVTELLQGTKLPGYSFGSESFYPLWVARALHTAGLIRSFVYSIDPVSKIPTLRWELTNAGKKWGKSLQAPKESESPQATRKKTYRIETYNMHRNPPTESLTVQGYAPALIIAKTLQATRQFSVLLRHVDANGRVGSAIRFRS
jgi:hypothetical protein